MALALPVTGAAAREVGDIRGENSRGEAQYEGRTIDLEDGWEDATTCLVYDGGATTECFRTQGQADAAAMRIDRESSESSTSASTADALVSEDGDLAAAAYAYASGSCSSWLTLSDGNYDTGRTLRFRDRGYVQDLANWGFAYATSSYTTGACSVTMYDGSWWTYPGDTTPWTDANWMASGWDNRVRRIYIH